MPALEGRVKVLLAFTVTLYFLVVSSLSFDELSISDRHEIPLGNLNYVLTKFIVSGFIVWRVFIEQA